jgi:polyhydroxybutyrate depolymerase
MRSPRPAALATLTAGLIVIAIAVAGCSSSSADSSTSQPQSTPSRPATTTTTVPAHASGPSAGCKATPAAPGTTEQTISSGGEERSYQLDVPDSYDGTTPYPLVFALHSLTVDHRIVPAMGGFADMHEKYRFIDVSPSGLTNPVPFWNAAPVEDNYDVTFISHLLDHLEATLCIDTAKVFSVGMSNGAQMSSLLACRLPDRITAVAPIAGVEFNDPCRGAPVPVIAFHGLKDPYVPYAGGGLNSVTIANQNFYKGKVPAGTATPTGVEQSMKRWAEHNGCDADFVEKRISPEVRERTWQHCRAPTEIYLVDNGGHAWPGHCVPAFESSFGHCTNDIDATTLIWASWFDH